MPLFSSARALLGAAGSQPSGNTIVFKLWGAGGGSAAGGSEPSGSGGYATGQLNNVPSGTQFAIVVGRGGIEGFGTGNQIQQYGGGGRNTGTDWGSGGGLAGVFSGTSPVTFDASGQARAILIAGAGAAGAAVETGGEGGGLAGNAGSASGTGVAGTGGDQVAGGTGVNNGAALKGGDGGGPAGGAGYFGGGSATAESGGGNRAGGGAGSSYLDGDGTYTPVNTSTTAGSGATPGNSADPDRPAGVGEGQTTQAEGGPAAVVVYVNGVLDTTFTYTGADQIFTVP